MAADRGVLGSLYDAAVRGDVFVLYDDGGSASASAFSVGHEHQRHGRQLLSTVAGVGVGVFLLFFFL